jgi:hypothetical protein
VDIFMSSDENQKLMSFKVSILVPFPCCEYGPTYLLRKI